MMFNAGPGSAGAFQQPALSCCRRFGGL